MEAFNKFLAQFPQYTPAAFEQVKPYLSEITLEPGAFFLHQGKVSKHIAFIKNGLVRQHYLHDGKEHTYCFCRENTVTASYKSLITQESSEISIQAIEKTSLIILSNEALQKLYNENPFWQQLGRLAAEGEFMRTEKHSSLLKDLSATDRYLHILENDNELVQRVPLNFLSSYLQIAPETLSRIRKKISRT